jgi:hypothetical protein
MAVAETVFWSCLAIAAHVYVGYPLLVWACAVLLGRRCAKYTADSGDLHDGPMVSLVILSGDDDAVIIQRLKQSLAQDFPSDQLEIVVACAADDHLTADLVNSFDDERVRLAHGPLVNTRQERLSEALAEASGEIIIVSNASMRLEENAVRKLVRGFRDPHVGAVHARQIPWDPSAGESVGGLWWQYESFIRRCELRLGNSPDRFETITAFRRDVLAAADADATLTSKAISKQTETSAWYSMVLLDVIGYEEPAIAKRRDGFDESETTEGLFGMPTTSNPTSSLAPGFGPFLFGFHRLLRWLSPITLLLAMAYNMYLASHPFYLRVLLLHELFYLGAMIILWLVHGGLGRRLFDMPTFLVRLGNVLTRPVRPRKTEASHGSSERVRREDETASTAV